MSYIRRNIESVLGLGVCNGKPSPRTVNNQLLTLTWTSSFNNSNIYLQFMNFEYQRAAGRCCPSDVQMVSASHYCSPLGLLLLRVECWTEELLWLSVNQRWSSNCDTEGQSSLLLPMLLASSAFLVAIVIHLSVRKDFSARNFNAVLLPPSPSSAFLTLSLFYSWH